jgi:hypothetical protein
MALFFQFLLVNHHRQGLTGKQNINITLKHVEPPRHIQKKHQKTNSLQLLDLPTGRLRKKGRPKPGR